MPTLHLSSSWDVLLLLIIAAAAFALSWFSYRITIPPVGQAKRFVLIALRGVGLSLLFFLLGEPLFSIIHHTKEQPAVAVLIDDSQSMSIKERTNDRAAVLRSVISSDVWNKLKKEGDVSFFLFDAKTKSIRTLAADSIFLNGAETDISQALKWTKKVFIAGNLQAAILITDGNSTAGSDPIYDAEDLGVPVFTVGIGDTSEQKDILIRKVLTNELTYAGNRLPVNVMVHSAGFNGEQVQVTLHHNGKEEDRQMLPLESGSREYAVTLSCIPEQVGIQKYTVDLSSLPGEMTLKNNRRSVFVKVLKSKMQVALVAA
ncbi:MAG TPA: vWA domain-containing protein, partial [Bacteroidota bacterium]|nr:vWA domain-containing protein [Bacteroidota bacterium]